MIPYNQRCPQEFMQSIFSCIILYGYRSSMQNILFKRTSQNQYRRRAKIYAHFFRLELFCFMVVSDLIAPVKRYYERVDDNR